MNLESRRDLAQSEVLNQTQRLDIDKVQRFVSDQHAVFIQGFFLNVYKMLQLLSRTY
jgi:hypothetical protein